MITNYRNYSRKKTVVAFSLLISVCLISLTLSCLSGVSGVKKEVDTGRVYDLAELDTPPRPKSIIIPTYPPEAKKRGIEGNVVVRLIVTKEGTAKDVRVFESPAEGVFDKAAIEAVKQQNFYPGIKDGEPVDTRVSRKIVFELPSSPSN